MYTLGFLTIVICPLHIYLHGISPVGIWLFVGFAAATTTGITAGYHRLYSHSTYKAHKFWHFLMLALGAATFQQSALKWSSLHRTHHQFTDTEKDPYDINKGFWYAHVGWILFWKRDIDFDNVKDLKKNALVMHQHEHFQYWAIGFGIVLPICIGAFYGQALEGLLFGFIARLFIVFQSTFFINSFAHTFGKVTYDTSVSAKDNWLGAILTGGEGYHNYHHKFPNDYRNGVRWYHWDPSKWIIWLLQFGQVTTDLRRASDEKIYEARLNTKTQLLKSSS
ncbi:MAG: stearoyl-CoA desaturase (delta-9 desaturase) [Candidatus Omnitrophota bacterium]|jgi:stearoyl-CoA desaturase (delta-9 desaturase)